MIFTVVRLFVRGVGEDDKFQKIALHAPVANVRSLVCAGLSWEHHALGVAVPSVPPLPALAQAHLAVLPPR
jgi:hypothetical protein